RGEARVPRRGQLGRGCELRVVRAAGCEGTEERFDFALASPRRRLLCARDGLAPGGDDTLIDAGPQRFLDARERVGNAGHALRGSGPVVIGVEAHEVEALPCRLDGAADDPDVA